MGSMESVGGVGGVGGGIVRRYQREVMERDGNTGKRKGREHPGEPRATVACVVPCVVLATLVLRSAGRLGA
ncbi:hypothetical protein ccbrp13_71070 [Ktedonobacteria bacterium brp13]|nr:hypothetical protein ccbrp13_71070 [Ktedonobacteria bacterium brp13]